VSVTIDPTTDTLTVGIDPTGGTNYTTVASGPLPAFYYNPTTGAEVAGIPPRVTFAFAGSSGGSTDIHEIGSVTATTLGGAAPVLSLSKTDNTGTGNVLPGGTLAYSLVAGVARSRRANATRRLRFPCGSRRARVVRSPTRPRSSRPMRRQSRPATRSTPPSALRRARSPP
jgi:hypothetical protein